MSDAPLPQGPMKYLIAHLQLVLAVIVGSVVFLLLPSPVRLATRLLVAWNTAIVVYVAVILVLMMRATEQSMRRRAALSDESRGVVLLLAVLASGAALAAIFAEMAGVKDMEGTARLLRILLSAGTILTSWTFIHIIFTQHYAHTYFSETDADDDGKPERRGGLKFPGGGTPDYIDFLYFTFTIGVASQTADVGLTSREMRKAALIHQIITFFFNTTILALSINIAASLT